jgi:hypothetical protein
MNYLFMYLAYLLGAAIFILDQIKKYEDIANANPDPSITYQKKKFWQKEKWTLIQIILLGAVSVIILPALFGGSSFALQKQDGSTLWTVPMKQALIPIQIICGWSGGRMILAFLGKSKKELYKKVGIEDEK